MSKLYIAYGSNLNLTQMAARCPSARVYAVGRLNNWQLVFRGLRASSHATIKRRKGYSVPVVVWTIQPQDERRLDIYEGYPTYYRKQDIMVEIGSQKRKAMVYVMNEAARPGRPAYSYVNTIRRGYFDNGLDMASLDAALEYNSLECVRNL